MSERNTELGNSRKRSPGEDKERAESVKAFLALVVCVLGILLGLVGLVTPFFTGPTTADVSIQAVGVLLGIVGFLLGARRLATAAVVFCIVAIFFGLAASQGLIPGIQGQDRTLPDEEPGAQRPG